MAYKRQSRRKWMNPGHQLSAFVSLIRPFFKKKVQLNLICSYIDDPDDEISLALQLAGRSLLDKC